MGNPGYSPGDIPALVHEAFRQLKTGRPRPVAIEISPQVFAAREEVQFVEPESYERPGGAPAQIERATRMLTQARRPVLWAGGGVIRAGAAKALQALAELLQAPVVTTRQGKGALSDRHPLCMGLAELRYAPLRRWLDERDLILAVGTHHDFTGYSQAVIQVDIDEMQIGRAEHVCDIVGDARVVLESLYEAVLDTAQARPSMAARRSGPCAPPALTRPSSSNRSGT